MTLQYSLEIVFIIYHIEYRRHIFFLSEFLFKQLRAIKYYVHRYNRNKILIHLKSQIKNVLVNYKLRGGSAL